MSLFRRQSTVAELAGSDQPLVKLLFPDAPDKPELYVHSFVLSFNSIVLRNVLEISSQCTNSSTTPTTTSNSNRSGSCSGTCIGPTDTSTNEAEPHKTISISLDDADYTVWERALVMLYPFMDPSKFQSNSPRNSTPAAQARGTVIQEVKDLLQLADKYDMPGLAAHLKDKLPTDQNSLVTWLGGENLSVIDAAFSWLEVCSKLYLEEQVKLCVTYISTQDVGFSLRLLAALRTVRQEHAEQLTAALQQQLQQQKQQHSLAKKAANIRRKQEVAAARRALQEVAAARRALHDDFLLNSRVGS